MKNRILFFTSDRCPACSYMYPMVERLAQEYPDVLIEEMPVGIDPATAQAYRVRAVPTLVVMRGNREVRRMTGASERYADLVRFATA